jgi:hypothetical protein
MPVAHACNPIWEAEIGKITVVNQPGQKVHKTFSTIAGQGGTYLSSQRRQEA